MSEDELKLKAMGLMHLDDSPNNLREIVGELNVSYAKLLRWRKEMRDAAETGTLHSLISADQVIVQRVADEVQHELEAIAPNESELITKEVAKVLTGIDGLNVLGEDLQAVAMAIATKLKAITLLTVDPKDLLLIVESLTKIQTAFFAKGTSVTVNNQQNNYSENQVSRFSGVNKKI